MVRTASFPIGMMIFLSSLHVLVVDVHGQEVRKPSSERFYVYSDADAEENHGYWTNYMPEEAGEMLDLDLVHSGKPHTGATCVKIDVKRWVDPKWAGLAVASKPDYWGKEPSDESFDLRGATKLVFHARGEQGGETIQFKVAVTGNEAYGDSATRPAATKWISLSKDWKKYEIDVRKMDLRRVITPFCFVTDKPHNRTDSVVLYIDDIYFEVPKD